MELRTLHYILSSRSGLPCCGQSVGCGGRRFRFGCLCVRSCHKKNPSSEITKNPASHGHFSLSSPSAILGGAASKQRSTVNDPLASLSLWKFDPRMNCQSYLV